MTIDEKLALYKTVIDELQKQHGSIRSKVSNFVSDLDSATVPVQVVRGS